MVQYNRQFFWPITFIDISLDIMILHFIFDFPKIKKNSNNFDKKKKVVKPRDVNHIYRCRPANVKICYLGFF